MSNLEIPYISFQSRSNQMDGIEIIKIEELLPKGKSLDHDPERAHQVAFNIMLFITAGESSHFVDFTRYKIQKNTLIYLSKGQVNAFQFSKELKGYIILFTDEFLSSQLNKLPKESFIRIVTSHLFSPKINIPEDTRILNYMDLLYHEYYKEEPDLHRNEVIEHLFHIIFSKLEQLKQYQTNHIQESDRLQTFLAFTSLLTKQFTKSRNAEYYADQLHISYKHLNTISKALVNSTAKQFIDAFVILEAKRHLINSSIKSTQLAYTLGFDEPTNFVKFFKKHTGFTPNRFKKDYSV